MVIKKVVTFSCFLSNVCYVNDQKRHANFYFLLLFKKKKKEVFVGASQVVSGQEVIGKAIEVAGLLGKSTGSFFASVIDQMSKLRILMRGIQIVLN